MDNEISLLMMVIVLLMIIRCYIAMASVSVTINIILWFVCCIAMFSVMIMSSIIGSTTLAFISAIVLAFSLGLFVTSAVMLRFCADANDKLKDLSRIVYNKLCNKILGHWQILIVMAVLRRCGLFAIYTNLDEFVWVCYAVLVDD